VARLFDRGPNLKIIFLSRSALFKITDFKIIISAKQEKNSVFDAFLEEVFYQICLDIKYVLCCFPNYRKRSKGPTFVMSELDCEIEVCINK